jgi:hypothetical protein
LTAVPALQILRAREVFLDQANKTLIKRADSSARALPEKAHNKLKARRTRQFCAGRRRGNGREDFW